MVDASPIDSGSRRGFAFLAESDVETRLWSVLFVSRQIGVVVAAVVIAAIPDFGNQRFVIAAAALFGVVPIDAWISWRTQIERRIHPLALTELLLAPAFVLWEPRFWIPAVVGSVAGLAIFAVTYRMPVPAMVTVLEAGLLAGAAAIVDVEMFAEGLVAFVLVAPPVVAALNALIRAISRSEHQYRDFLEYANDIVYTHDLRTLRFLTANEAAVRLTGYSREELGHITVADVVAPDDIGRAAEMIQRKLDGDTEATTYAIEIMAKDGRRIPVEVSTRVIYRRGDPVAIQGIARDISERQHVEAQQAALDKARSEFIANAAHELRTPLTTLAGLASVLASTRAQLSDAEIDEAVHALDRQGRRARLLADRLLDLSSVELGTIDVLREPVDVAEIVERVLEDAPPPAHVEVGVEVEPDTKALGDPIRTAEILQNFLTNAYRYGGPHVRVRAGHEDTAIVVEVIDDGPGVPEGLRAQLFEPFTRGDHGDSTGLGLAICARLVEAQGGEIAYEPDQPHGARFRVSLPAAS